MSLSHRSFPLPLLVLVLLQAHRCACNLPPDHIVLPECADPETRFATAISCIQEATNPKKPPSESTSCCINFEVELNTDTYCINDSCCLRSVAITATPSPAPGTAEKSEPIAAQRVVIVEPLAALSSSGGKCGKLGPSSKCTLQCAAFSTPGPGSDKRCGARGVVVPKRGVAYEGPPRCGPEGGSGDGGEELDEADDPNPSAEEGEDVSSGGKPREDEAGRNVSSDSLSAADEEAAGRAMTVAPPTLPGRGEGENGAEDDGDASCFPADARVEVRGRGSVAMEDLGVGDFVKVAGGVWSRVFMFTHYDASARAEFVRVKTESGAVLEATKGHFVYRDGGLVPAAELGVGDLVEVVGNREGGMHFEKVTLVVRVWKRGLYNPQTERGDIIVGGVRASTYTTAVEPSVAHVALRVVRGVIEGLGGRELGMGVVEQFVERTRWVVSQDTGGLSLF